jgi:anti-anti-sigma factor
MHQTMVCRPYGGETPVSGAGTRPDFSVTLTRRSGRTTVAVKGEIDLSNRGELARALSTALSRSEPIELDLTQVAFMDATGIQIVVEAADRAEAEELPLTVRVGQIAERLFVLTGIDSRLSMIRGHGAGDAGSTT